MAKNIIEVNLDKEKTKRIVDVHIKGETDEIIFCFIGLLQQILSEEDLTEMFNEAIKNVKTKEGIAKETAKGKYS